MNKKITKTIAMILLPIIIITIIAVGIIAWKKQSKTETLVIYNWADYIDPSVIADYENYYYETTGNKIKVIYTTFETNETMITEIMKGDSQIDLICPSEYALQKLMKKGMLNKLDMDSKTYENIVNIYPSIIEKVDDTFESVQLNGENIRLNDYFVPYMWGTLGILYNTDYVTEADLNEGWGLLWNKANNPKLEGKILMKDSVRDVYAATITYLIEENLLPEQHKGKSIEELINTVDKSLLTATENALKAQRKHLKGYEVDFGKDDMITGIAYVDLAWSGDALWAIEESAGNLDYFVPETGGNVWFDGWAIPTSAQNIEAAKLFIDYLCRPDIAMRNAMEIGYTCAINPDVFLDENNENSVEALAYLEECEYGVDEYFNDIRRYPVMNENLGVMQDFDENNDAVVAMWERVKGDADYPWALLLFLLILLLILGGAYGIIVFLRHQKNKRQYIKTITV